MNSGLDKIRVIDRARLSTEQYFESLLAQAREKELLTDADIERLQLECVALLADKVERYNLGDSSIRVEKAQSLMTSNLFTISLWLKTYPNPDDAVIALQSEPIAELYKKGRKRIDTMLMSARTIHQKLIGQLVETKNVFYRSAIADGINGFFKLYYADFAAQEIHITADYPVCNAFPKLAGIEFIQAYLNALYYENEFCAKFSADDIHHLLCGYAEDYAEILMNIYEPVLTTAVGCTLAGADVAGLDVMENGAVYLTNLFANMPRAEIFRMIQEAAEKLAEQFQFSAGLARYIQNSLPILAEKIEIGAQEHTLDGVFFVPAYPENKPKIVFSFGEKMDDEQYRKVIDEIMQCDSAQEKANVVQQHIRSLADLEDVLMDAEMSKEEIQTVLRSLGLPELAALLKRNPFTTQMEAFDLREQERLLMESLHEVIRQLPQAQQAMVIKASAAIEENEEAEE